MPSAASLLPWAFALVMTSPLAGTPALPGPAFPQYGERAALDARCASQLAAAEAALRRLEAHTAGAGWLAAWDDFGARIEDLANPVYLISNVHPVKAIRDAAEACELRWQNFQSALTQNERLYRAARRVRPRDAVERQLLKSTLESFEDSGVGLPRAARARARAIQDRLSELGQHFDRNLRDEAVRLPFTEAELEGVPEGVWKAAPRDAQGRVLLGLEYPVSVPVLQGAVDAGARERMWRAKQSEGGVENLKLLAEIARLRLEYAKLFGFASFADFALRRRMAGDIGTAQRFLDQVQRAVEPRERRELEELRAAKAQELGRPLEAVKLERWDVAYYTERVKRARFSVDQEALRPHFPPQESLAFVMRVAETMFGVRYRRVEGVPLWHPEAQAWVATDAATGTDLATLYIDAYPRPGKYNHAAVWPLRSGSVRRGRVPQAALVVNFDRKGLSLEEIETLLHEFGHALHNNLGATRFAGGASVLADFVEAPSQMLEDWVYDPKVIALMREVCPACKPLPEALLAQARVAQRYGKGVEYERQRLFASFDLQLHGPDAPEPMALWQRLESRTLLGHVPGTMFPAGFSHVASNGNYSAGYYGYLWSEVLAADLRTAFGADKLDPRVGRRWRATVLARGGELPPEQLLREFLGRDSSPKAFFDELTR